eukprot:COSAG02_NODE_6378_length_3611_cov_203.740319_2_plen_39_part_00
MSNTEWVLRIPEFRRVTNPADMSLPLPVIIAEGECNPI